MKTDRTRLARRSLVGLLIAVSAAVAWSLRKPPSPRAGAPDSHPFGTGPSQGTTVQDLVFLRFKEGGRPIEVKAKASAGQDDGGQRFRGVQVAFPFVDRGRPGTATISGDDCTFQQEPVKASFKGNVRLTTDDGFELQTQSLKYLSQPAVEVRSQEGVVFRRGRVSGTADNMLYREGSGLQLTGNVKLRVDEQGATATEVTSATASLSRDQGYVWFEGGVVVQQAARVIHAKRLELKLTPDLGAVTQASAIDDVDVQTTGAASLPGVVAGSPGGTRLRCRRLNLGFRAEGQLEQASALNSGVLELLPGPGDPTELRRLSSARLLFRFDEQGRLTALDAEAGGPQAPGEERRTVLVTEPTAPGGSARRVESRSLHATLDPASGALRTADFTGSVAYSEPGRKAWAEHVSLDEATGLVTLDQGDARVADETQGELRGEQIRLGTRSHGVKATGNVQHTVRQKEGGGVGPFGGNEPVVVRCRRFEYDSGSRTARYLEDARMRAGRDEIRAATIEVLEAAEGQRRLTASGSVMSLLHPRNRNRPGRESAPIETRSREMVYEEKARRVVYSGEVEIRQGDLVSKSPEAIALLKEDGRTIDRVLAGAPVEARRGPRHAAGERATYTPDDETLVLVGDKVILEDAEGRVEGRTLTFEARNDRIRIDGREEVRTEAVFKRKEPIRH